jgi:peptidoglycan/LPS O-acetylase OafA/YrhL
MKDRRLPYVVPIAAAVALLVLSLMAYAGLLTSAWSTLSWCAPAILVTIGVVAGMAVGVVLFGTEEAETPQEAAKPDGVALLDRLGAWIDRLARRAAFRLRGRAGH